MHRPMHFAEKNEAHVRRRTISMIYDSNDRSHLHPADEESDPGNRSAAQSRSEHGATAVASSRCNTTDNGDPGPEVKRAARIFRQFYRIVRSLRTWKCTATSTMMYKRVLLSRDASRISRAESSVNFTSKLM